LKLAPLFPTFFLSVIWTVIKSLTSRSDFGHGPLLEEMGKSTKGAMSKLEIVGIVGVGLRLL
jgi:hypothetical protein